MSLVGYTFRMEWQDQWSKAVEEAVLHEALYYRVSKLQPRWRLKLRGDDKFSAWQDKKVEIVDRGQARLLRAEIGDVLTIDSEHGGIFRTKKCNLAPPVRVSNATAPTKTVIAALRHAFPNHLNYGWYNCRRIDGSETWSQHAWGAAYDAGGDILLVVEMGDFLVDQAQKWWKEKEKNPNEKPTYGLPVGKVIYNRRVWTPDGGYAYYGGTDPHTGHLHVENPQAKMGEPPCSK